MKTLVLMLFVCSLTACAVDQLDDVVTATAEQPIKRQATVNVVSSNALLFKDGTSSMQTCHGDSGGPAFQGSAVVGTTSFGLDLIPGVLVCFGGGSHCRVDSGLSFISPNTY